MGKSYKLSTVPLCVKLQNTDKKAIKLHYSREWY